MMMSQQFVCGSAPYGVFFGPLRRAQGVSGLRLFISGGAADAASTLSVWVGLGQPPREPASNGVTQTAAQARPLAKVMDWPLPTSFDGILDNGNGTWLDIAFEADAISDGDWLLVALNGDAGVGVVATLR